MKQFIGWARPVRDVVKGNDRDATKALDARTTKSSERSS